MPDEEAPESTRHSLLLRLKQDGPARELAWSDFYERYAPVISGFARRFGVPVDQHADIVQDVMLGFFSAQPRFTFDPEKGRFRGYLRTCVVHVLSKRRRGGAQFEGQSTDDLDPADPSVKEAWTSIWEREQLATALREVRTQYGDNATFRAFYLTTIEQRPVDEVARELALSADSVYQARVRVMAKLKSALKRLDEED